MVEVYTSPRQKSIYFYQGGSMKSSAYRSYDELRTAAVSQRGTSGQSAGHRTVLRLRAHARKKLSNFEIRKSAAGSKGTIHQMGGGECRR